MKRDIITKVQTTYTPDGSGGYTEETVELGSYEVKLSVSNNVEEATAYGVSIEQVLKVIADVPLLEDEAGLNMIIGQQGNPGPAATINGVNALKIEAGANIYLDQQDNKLIISSSGGGGGTGGDRATFIPEVSEDGVISWTNNKGLPNPDPVNIKGPQGAKGDTGAQGEQGIPGEKGDKGDPGEKGDTGAQGPQGIQGERGIQGEPGPKGDTGAIGPQGEPGYTPIKGVDYFTEADVQAIVQQVLNSLPQAEGGLF